MPFTPAHPAIVLPFLKSRYVSATGLIIGSLAPDFEYFFKMRTAGEHGHTIAGLFYFDLPVVVVLAFLFHQVVKRNFISNLPLFLQRRLQDVVRFDFIGYVRNNPLVFLLSGLLGSASHLFWDSFTHGYGYFVKTLWFYEDVYYSFNGATYPLFYVLQYVSSGIGLFFVGVYVLKRRSIHADRVSSPSALYWLAFFTISALVVWARFIVRPNDYSLANLVVSIISALCLASVTCGLSFYRRTQSCQS